MAKQRILKFAILAIVVATSSKATRAQMFDVSGNVGQSNDRLKPSLKQSANHDASNGQAWHTTADIDLSKERLNNPHDLEHEPHGRGTVAMVADEHSETTLADSSGALTGKGTNDGRVVPSVSIPRLTRRYKIVEPDRVVSPPLNDAHMYREFLGTSEANKNAFNREERAEAAAEKEEYEAEKAKPRPDVQTAKTDGRTPNATGPNIFGRATGRSTPRGFTAILAQRKPKWQTKSVKFLPPPHEGKSFVEVLERCCWPFSSAPASRAERRPSPPTFTKEQVLAAIKETVAELQAEGVISAEEVVHVHILLQEHVKHCARSDPMSETQAEECCESADAAIELLLQDPTPNEVDLALQEMRPIFAAHLNGSQGMALPDFQKFFAKVTHGLFSAEEVAEIHREIAQPLDWETFSAFFKESVLAGM